MLRQMAVLDPATGRTRIAWVDQGPCRAIPHHGRLTGSHIGSRKPAMKEKSS